MSPFKQKQKQQVQQQIDTTKFVEIPMYSHYYDADMNQYGVYGTLNINNYEEFCGQMEKLSKRNVSTKSAAKQQNLSYKERRDRDKRIEREKEEYKKLSKKQSLMRMEEISDIDLFKTEYGLEQWKKEKVSHSKLTREETMRRMLEEKDYSNFENLDGVMRNMVASIALSKFVKEYNVTKDSDPADLVEKIKSKTKGVSGLLDPGLRLGLSLAQRTENMNEDMKELFRKLDEEMSTAVMVETLTHKPIQENVEQYFIDKKVKNPQEKAKEAIEANKAQQIQIAKRLFLMQLSNFKKLNAKGDPEKWDKSMAVALSHCSRVVLTLPKVDGFLNTEEEQTEMWKAILTTNGENLAQDNPRGGSTHNVERRKVGDTSGISKEKKVIVNTVGQRGMNCAIGGLGNYGIGEKLLSNDGSCGHFYSMHKEGDEKYYGTMLMGLESDAHGVMNQMGHTHDIHATPEKASSLGGQRVDEVGKKYGGRQCDLSHIYMNEITRKMQTLERAIKRWQDSDGDYQDILEETMTLLAGKQMTQKQFDDFGKNLGIIRGNWQ